MYRKRIAEADKLSAESKANKTVCELVVCQLANSELNAPSSSEREMLRDILSADKILPQEKIDTYKKIMDMYREILGTFYGEDKVGDLLQKITPEEIAAGLKEAVERRFAYETVAQKMRCIENPPRRFDYFPSETIDEFVDYFNDQHDYRFPGLKVPSKQAAIDFMRDEYARLDICRYTSPINVDLKADLAGVLEP